MANAVFFSQPIDDEFFSAHEPFTDPLLGNIPGYPNLYRSDGTAHVLGCATQEQLCLRKNYCTPLTAWVYTDPSRYNMNMTGRQRESINVWRNSISRTGAVMDAMIDNLGASALVARNSFIGGIQGPLSPNQWQLEVAHWQATTMAMIQRLAVEYATGPSDGLVRNVEPPSNKEARSICKNQVSVT